ncbi:hypothetical protein [Rhodococcus sp. CX]|uniref:hypothetical protein n=1 Tax=Rhodococcus sp. CX TaxID=2789880 RepID=UPI001E5B8B96|nr:hypothetical protein [Rhodococcus sp. CX]
MAIEHYDLLSDEGWADASAEQISRVNLWNAGGVLADAPVDVERTLKGNVWVSSKVDTSFHLNGIRLAPSYSLPRRHSNLDGQVIVFGGQFTITWDEDGAEASRTIGPGEFWTITAGTPHVLTAGAEGVTFLETWSEPLANLEITWHETGWVHP